MENLTYRAYLEDPEIRVQIEREVRRARAQAVREFILAPAARMFVRMFALLGRAPKQSRAIRMTA